MQGPDTHGPPQPVTFITMMPSPYQVELFDELARQGRFQPFVIYLRGSLPDRSWQRMPLQHQALVLDESPGAWAEAWRQVMQAPLVVFAYYTHAFALAALHWRARVGRPWAYWGERPGFLQLGRLGRLLRRWLLRPLRRSQVPVWGIGEFALEGYREELGAAREYANVPYASNLNPYLKIRRAPPARGVSFLFSGALIRRKGVTALARAFVQLAREDASVSLVIMGSGPLRPVLENLLAPVRERVAWLGFVDWRELPRGYAGADVLCAPSRYDGWGLVVVEGMAAGMPVIATRSMGAARELIDLGRNGWLIPPDDEAALLAAMRQAAGLDPEALAGMGAAAREAARAQHVSAGAVRLADAAASALRAAGVVLRPAERLRPRVLLVGNYLPDRQHSMQRYGQLLERGLGAAGMEVTVIRPAVRLGGLARAGSRAAKWLGYADKFVCFSPELWLRARWHVRRPRSLVHIIDQGNGSYLPLVQQLPHVLTCHDLIAVLAGTGKSGGRRSAYQEYNRQALSLARWIICVSEATRWQCVLDLGLAAERCVVIYNPLDPFFLAPAAGRRPAELPAQYLLHVGSSAWYKNRAGLLRIYGELRALGCQLPLVLMGEPLNAAEQQLADALGVSAHLVRIGHPTDELVRAAYAHAEALVFPSLREGFGWPIIEALAQGAAVFTTGRAPMTEAGGGAAAYFDPEKPRAAAELILAGLAQRRADPAAAAQGRAHAASFAMDEFVARHAALYARVLADAQLPQCP